MFLVELFFFFCPELEVWCWYFSDSLRLVVPFLVKNFSIGLVVDRGLFFFFFGFLYCFYLSDVLKQNLSGILYSHHCDVYDLLQIFSQNFDCQYTIKKLCVFVFENYICRKRICCYVFLLPLIHGVLSVARQKDYKFSCATSAKILVVSCVNTS